MKITHYYKDACRIYWRVECTSNVCGDSEVWDVEVYRSLEDFDDPEAHEAFHTSIPRLGDEVDTAQIVADMSRYYQGVLLGMAAHLGSTFEPKIDLSPGDVPVQNPGA